MGITDEGLSPAGRQELFKIREHLNNEKPEIIFRSPLCRCRESADILFPGIPQIVIPEFTETDFGAFEYHTYEELKDNAAYRAWIASGGQTGCPGGESAGQVKERIQAGWEILCRKMKRNMTNGMATIAGETTSNIVDGKAELEYGAVEADRAAKIYCEKGSNGSDDGALLHGVLLAHGGTIMELLSLYGEPKKNYYDWQVSCGHGYRCLWEDKTKRLLVQEVWPPASERKEEKQKL